MKKYVIILSVYFCALTAMEQYRPFGRIYFGDKNRDIPTQDLVLSPVSSSILFTLIEKPTVPECRNISACRTADTLTIIFDQGDQRFQLKYRNNQIPGMVTEIQSKQKKKNELEKIRKRMFLENILNQEQ